MICFALLAPRQRLVSNIMIVCKNDRSTRNHYVGCYLNFGCAIDSYRSLEDNVFTHTESTSRLMNVCKEYIFFNFDLCKTKSPTIENLASFRQSWEREQSGRNIKFSPIFNLA